ncbi:MMPL family transporter [Kitasatospora sp. NBC_01287]|uniref:MMPL family transporter n=1 Tax=Kitasatospora sp. NBC_01287 TaxID=2903573 RepID=UPI002257255D|nr:MMPL family transporter [Kitasatospora sp. NBC_01287]MCX4745867.1 MMPL family transporter [Kitasatospora sp. NBC_01287]
MATFLHGIGQFAFRRRRLVLLLWVLILGTVGIAAATSSAGTNTAVSLPGTESQRAFDLLAEKFPAANADGASARVVLRAPSGEQITSAENKTDVATALKALKGSSPGIASVSDPFTTGAVSKDGTTAYTQVTYTAKDTALTAADHEGLDHALQEGRDTGLTVEATGTALAPGEQSGAGEMVGFLLAGVILTITFGSLVAAGLPLLSAIMGVGVSVAAITALSSAFNLNSNTSTLATMLGIAVGIDYALFIISRYRAERADGHSAQEAAARANGTAGSAVVFAGLTVVIALVGLCVVNLPMLTAMGLGAAGAVVVSVLVAVTLVPALLGFAPERARGRARERTGRTAQVAAEQATRQATGRGGRTSIAQRWSALVLRRPLLVLLTAVIGLGVIALPATKLELGLGDDSSRPADSTQHKAYDMLAESFGPGFNGPLTVAVTAADPATTAGAATALHDGIATMPDVAGTTPPVFNQARDTAIISVIPKSAPSSDATTGLVHDIRVLAADTGARTGAEGMVTGTTAVNIDVSDKFSSAIVPYLALVVGLAFLVLILVFRSVLVPLKAALGFLLSVLASLGALVAVFQWGWLSGLLGIEQPGPIMSLMPILMVGIVFGLAMDYQVFLVTRIRESYVRGADPRTAISTGFRHSATVVTAAATIMIAVFSGFMGSSESMIKSIGFGLAIAVAFDAFVVRMTIVPAVLALLGHKAWWLPRWLDRIVPNVDIEGEKLAHTLPAARTEEADAPVPAGAPR